MADVKYLRNGGRTVELFLPFDHLGMKITEISFAPMRLDHRLRWQNGQIQSILALMAELAGVTEDTLKFLADPDVDRVIAVFTDMLPPEIRTGIVNLSIAESTGAIAEARKQAEQTDATLAPKTDEMGPTFAPPPQEQQPVPVATEPPKDSMGLGLDLGDGHSN